MMWESNSKNPAARDDSPSDLSWRNSSRLCQQHVERFPFGHLGVAESPPRHNGHDRRSGEIRGIFVETVGGCVDMELPISMLCTRVESTVSWSENDPSMCINQQNLLPCHLSNTQSKHVSIVQGKGRFGSGRVPRMRQPSEMFRRQQRNPSRAGNRPHTSNESNQTNDDARHESNQNVVNLAISDFILD